MFQLGFFMGTLWGTGGIRGEQAGTWACRLKGESPADFRGLGVLLAKWAQPRGVEGAVTTIFLTCPLLLRSLGSAIVWSGQCIGTHHQSPPGAGQPSPTSVLPRLLAALWGGQAASPALVGSDAMGWEFGPGLSWSWSRRGQRGLFPCLSQFYFPSIPRSCGSFHF